MKRVTIAQVADEAGLSLSTVNRVVSGKVSVRPETAQHVLAIAERLGFYGVGTIRGRIRGDRAERSVGLLVQQESMPFHHDLAHRFHVKADEKQDVMLLPQVEHMEDLDPFKIAERLRALGQKCDAVALSVADHPAINAVIEELADLGKPVFSAISDLSSPRRAGYVGIDNRRFGRAAGWYASRLDRSGKEIAMLVGTHRHMCQEQREMGFRMYLRENAPDLIVLEAVTTFETDEGAYEATHDLLRRRANLGAIYVLGGGIRGCIRALRESREGRLPIVITCELNDDTRAALMDGIVAVALAHPLEKVAANLVEVMNCAIDEGKEWVRKDVILPFTTSISENV
ncbi:MULTISPECIES: LacI family DNA-binding transcriptional regulator [unclassified Mesorhizobium]|uniref:LacI family DNA-binding transcriptional regulator n=1 Tax=unclassified Mesorhizobium TaxID=325217 RepID=UPI0013DFF7C0|nr:MULTISPECIES: LacI family DNA-binding transcriptional regulator [unclassified Mesorhizobium]